jgi:hypothetical protein
MSCDLSNIELKPNAELVVSKSGKVYYKSLYNTIKKYNDKNREKINEISRERYRNNPYYKEQNKENNRKRYYRLKTNQNSIVTDTQNASPSE